jgi:Na/Pi-cotransporter
LTVFNVFSLLGGLAFFLYGMQLLGASLEQRAGSRLKPILESLTSSKLKGVMVGAVVTAVVQSSSATTVMLVGFVNSGIMQLHQAISVIFGANIGTTITSWFLSLSGIESSNFWVSLLKPSNFAPLMAFIGIIMFFTAKQKKDVASIFLGFAILMFGMETMSGAVKGLAEVPAFVNLLTLFSNPLLGVLAGTLITGIIQSSTASIGILQALANTGTVSYAAALPIIMGQNIGTCVTAIISSVGANKNAKRVALAHLFFNVIGTGLFLVVYYIVRGLFDIQLADAPIGALGIAIFHSIFNLACTIVMYPFIGGLEKLVMKVIREDGKDAATDFMLDERLLATPTIAIEQCRKMVCDMAALTRDALLISLEMVKSYSDKEAEKVLEMESMVDTYEDKLGSYLVKISMRNLSEHDSKEVSKLLHCIGDFERISDHARNIVECAQEKSDKGLQFSDEAQGELAMMKSAVVEIVETAFQCFSSNNMPLAAEVEPLEQVIDTITVEIKARHIQRLQAGACTIEMGFILSDLMTNLERVADHCSNIAVSVIEVEQYGELNNHQYLRDMRSGQFGEGFSEKYSEYLTKYKLP